MLYATKTYEIDFNKVKTHKDVISILKGLNIKFITHPDLMDEDLKPYLKEEEI